jgi:hypothetical protein
MPHKATQKAQDATGPRTTVLLSKSSAESLLERLERPSATARHSLPAPDEGTSPTPDAVSTSDRYNAVLGCKTDEVALTLLSQLVELEPDNVRTCSDERVDQMLMKATAMLAELEPRTATEAMLGAQMVGAQRMAMNFMQRASLAGQPSEFVDANVNRAVKLMRVFNEQIETMAKLKGTSGQQRVVVEHVNVQAGGQAIVGTVIPRGPSGGDSGDRR